MRSVGHAATMCRRSQIRIAMTVSVTNRASRVVLSVGAPSPHPLARLQNPVALMHNALEEVIDSVFEQLVAGRAHFCDCAQCRDDVITHALNQARPRYVSGSLIGSAVTRVALSHEQARAELAVLVLDAMRRVAARPRHSQPSVGSGEAVG